MLNSERRESEEGGGRLMGVPALDLALIAFTREEEEKGDEAFSLPFGIMLNYCR